MTTASGPGPAATNRWLRWLLCAAVLSLALYQFSEATADPDLWAHVLFGERHWLTGEFHRTEIYSWTAQGLPFINHEVLAEAVIGGSHLLAGGTGILLLKMLFGMLTFGLALRLGGQGLAWPMKAVTWVIGALAVVEISYGFPPRPQIFTGLALAIQFWLLRRAHENKLAWAIAFPLLFGVWINAHGGSLAGLGLMVVTAGASTLQDLRYRLAGTRRPSPAPLPVSRKAVVVLWIATAACGLALLANPWGYELIRWIVVAVLWPRPQIEEWNPAGLGWDHAAFFILLLLTTAGFVCSRRRRAWWEIAVCAVLAVQALKTVRHTPLFCIAALSFAPAHIADALERFREHFARLEELFSRDSARKALCFVLGAAIAGIVMAGFRLHREHGLTMEVPRGQYPLGAVDFMRRTELRGNLLCFFDWGEMCLWELPDCAVSMDGRMDACYPHDLITEHWRFYNAQPVNKDVLDLSRADLALLPANLAGAVALGKKLGWRAVYFDDVAVVLARDTARFPKLPPGILALQGDPKDTTGRTRFPDDLPPRLAQLKAK